MNGPIPESYMRRLKEAADDEQELRELRAKASPEYHAAVEGLVEILKKINGYCTEQEGSAHLLNLTTEVCRKLSLEGLAAFEKAKAGK